MTKRIQPDDPEFFLPPSFRKESKQVLRPQTLVYKVGVDLTEDEYRTILLKLTAWFEERGASKPADRASRYLDACLKGVRPTDPTKLWIGAEGHSLRQRIRQACRFDIETMKPILTKADNRRRKKAVLDARAKKAKAEKHIDPMTPEIVRVQARKGAVYGDDPNVRLSAKEHENWMELRNGFIREFPELDAVHHKAELDMLCDTMTLAERLRHKMLDGNSTAVSQYETLVSVVERVKKALGIHPDQLAKRKAEQESASLAAALARFEEMPDWRERREQHWKEELIQLYQMYQQPSPRRDQGGYQLDEAGLLGLTGCRTCSCAKCGTKNFAGLNIEEVEAYLVRQRLLEVDVPLPEPPTPTEAKLIERGADAFDPAKTVEWEKDFKSAVEGLEP